MTDRHNRFLGNRVLSPETLMMGYGYDPFLSERSLKPPVFQTSTFVFRSAQRLTENELSDFSRLWHDGCVKAIIEAQDVDRNHPAQV